MSVPPTPKRFYGDKALKKLGISAQHLTHNFLGGGENKGSLSFREFFIFWSEMTRIQRTSMYLKLLIIDLMDVLDKKKGDSKRSYPIQAVVNTINFLAMHFPIADRAITRDLQNTLKKWEDNRVLYANNREASSAEEVIRTIAKRLVDNKPAIDTLIIQCATLHSLDEFKELSDVIRVPTMHGRRIQSGEFSQVYSFLKRQAARSPEILKEILNVSLTQMRTLPQQIKMSAKLSETFLLALLHMLKQFVSYWRLPDSGFTSKAVRSLKQFYLWPSPCGEATRDLLIIFKTESLAPGNELLQRFAHESTVPKVIASNLEGHVQVCRPVYYIIDQGNTQSQKISSLMFLRSYVDDVKDSHEEGDPNAFYWEEMEQEVVTPGLSPKVMAMLMLSVIQHDVEVLPRDLVNVRYLSADDVYTLFDQVVGILHGAQEYGSVEEAKEWRIQGLNELKGQIENFAEQNRGDTRFQAISLPDDLPADFMPELPKLVHLSIPTIISYHMPTRAFIDENMYTPIPKTPVLAHLKSIVEKFDYLADPDNPARIRLVIAGDDSLLHAVVVAYMSLRQIPQFLDGIELQFFLVPFRENHLASFLARHDSWYNRHIYVPFSPNYLLPQCQASQNNEDFSELGIPPPAQVWRENVEHFVREADNVVTIQLFKCEAWINIPVSTELPDQSLPFCQGLKISSEITKMKLQRKRVEEMVNSKNISSPELTIDLEPVDIMGIRTTFKKEDCNLIYQSVVMNNVPHENDPCHPADPTTPWLETYCQVSEQQRHQKKDKRSPYSIDKKLHVTRAVITAAKPEGAFDVLIDGVIFGSFQKIVVTPIVTNEQDPEAEHISFPLHTFFPLDL